jgi:hypothetical protein
MSIRNELLERTQYESDILADTRVRTLPLTQAELASAEGYRYYSEFTTVLSTLDTVYVLYQMPPVESGVVIALQERRFKSESGGADLEILWDSTGVIPGTLLPIFNQNRNSANVAQMELSVIATPTTDGIIRETDFLNSTGSGSNSSGDISPASGSRIYSPSSFFIAKITNTHNQDNRILLTYTHAEISISSFS